MLGAYAAAFLLAKNTILAMIGMVLLLIAVVPFAWARFTRRGRKAVKTSAAADWGGTYATGFFLLATATAGFALLSVVLYRIGFDGVHGARLHGSDSLNVAYVSLLWHLANAVPLLDVPATVHWKLNHYLTHWSQGTVVVAYKATVILPLVYVASLLFARVLQDESPAQDQEVRDAADSTRMVNDSSAHPDKGDHP